MRRVTESQTISLEEIRALALARFGDMIKGVVDLDRGILLLDADLHADQEASLLASLGNRSRGVDNPTTRAAIASFIARVVRR